MSLAGEDPDIRADGLAGPREAVALGNNVDGEVVEADLPSFEGLHGAQRRVAMGDHGIGEVVFFEGYTGHAGEDAGNLAGVAETAALGPPLFAVLEHLVGVARAGVVAHLVELARHAGAGVGEFREADGVMRIAPVGQVGDVLAAF